MGSRARSSEGLEEFVGLSAGIARLDGLLDVSLGADHVGDPSWVSIVRVGAGLVGQAHGAVRVAEQGVGEVELLCEGAILFDGVEGGAEDDDVLLAQFGGSITEPASLLRSPGCVGLGEVPEDQALSAEVGEADGLACVGGALEVGSRVTDGEEVGVGHEESLEEGA